MCAALWCPAWLRGEPSAEAAKIFDVPAKDILTSLRQFSAQSGEQLLYSADAISGVLTAAIKGTFTSQTALDRMLRGTGLIAIRDRKTRAFTISCNDPEAHRAAQLAGAEDQASAKKKLWESMTTTLQQTKK